MLRRYYRNCRSSLPLNCFSSATATSANSKRGIFTDNHDDDIIPITPTGLGKKKGGKAKGKDDGFDLLLRKATNAAEVVTQAPPKPEPIRKTLDTSSSTSPFNTKLDTKIDLTNTPPKPTRTTRQLSEDLDSFFRKDTMQTPPPSPMSRSRSSTFDLADDNEFFNTSKPSSRNTSMDSGNYRTNAQASSSSSHRKSNSFDDDFFNISPNNNQNTSTNTNRLNDSFFNNNNNQNTSFSFNRSRDRAPRGDFDRNSFDFDRSPPRSRSPSSSSRFPPRDFNTSYDDAYPGNSTTSGKPYTPASYISETGEFVRTSDFIHNKKPSSKTILSYDKPSPWNTIRGTNEALLSPSLPVPIRGDILYGYHPVISALTHKTREEYYTLYIQSNIYDELKELEKIEKQSRLNKKQPISLEDLPDNSLTDDNTDALKKLLDNPLELTEQLVQTNEFAETSAQLHAKYESIAMQLAPTSKHVYKVAKNMKKLKIHSLSRQKLDIISENRPHNGFVLDVSPLPIIDYTYLPPNLPPKQLSGGSSKNNAQLPVKLFIALDNITDPQNVGAIARACAYFGAQGLITSTSNTSPFTATTAKAASGALEALHIIKTKDLSVFLSKTKEQFIDLENPAVRNLIVVGLTVTDHSIPLVQLSQYITDNLLVTSEVFTPMMETSIKEGDTRPTVILVMGSEHEGISADVLHHCDVTAKIMGMSSSKLLDSLNVSAATSIALHEITASFINAERK